jgi:hypothetical protein
VEENAIATSSAILRRTLDPSGLKADSGAVPPDRVQVAAVEFHYALESRHGYGSQTSHRQ